MKFVSNVDTIYILVDIENYEKESKEIIDYLRVEKEKAKVEVTDNMDTKHFIEINDMTFQLLPNSCKGYAFILKNEGYEIKVSQYRSKIEDFCPIQVRISSEYLWSQGVYPAWAMIYNWIVETFGNIKTNKVCRIDLCSHISGVDFTTDYEKVYKGKYKKRQLFHTGSSINCLCFGSRKGKNVYCRIYNKTLEIQETKKKEWFKEVWKKNNLDIENVWNVEFEIKSELLRKYQLASVVDIITHLQDIWRYCTQEWLIKIDRINERVERCPVNKEWQKIQQNYNDFEMQGLIEREQQIRLDADVLIPNIMGSLTSYSARKNNWEIEQAFKNLFNDLERYLRKSKKNFKEEVIKKQKTLETFKEKGERNGRNFDNK